MITAKLDSSQIDTLDDLCRCPGLFAGQYKEIERLPRGTVEYRYPSGIYLMLGLPKAYPTDAAHDLLEQVQS